MIAYISTTILYMDSNRGISHFTPSTLQLCYNVNPAMPPKLANRRQQEASGSDDSFNVISENTIELMINKAIKGAMKDFKITIQELIKKQFEEFEPK